MSLTSEDNLFYKDKGKRPIVRRNFKMLSTENIILIITLVAFLYNSIFAALLAHGFPISRSAPTLAEVTLLLSCGLVIISRRIDKSSIFPISLAYFVIVASIFISVKDEQFYVVPVRNFLIISMFTIVGGLCSFKTLQKVFNISSVAVVISLIFEVMWLDSYVSFFQPARYLSITRGIAESEYSGGLSAGTIAFKGRFSLGLYSGPRTSSIFLEQVSINCYAIIIALYLLTFAPKLKKIEIGLHASTIFFVLATNNARMALIVSAIFTAGYSTFSRLPSYLNIVLMPATVLSLFITFSFTPTTGGDDLLGRMTTTYDLLNSMSIDSLLLGSVRGTLRSLDSGYAFIIFSTTMFGLIFYWIFISLVIPQVNDLSKRCAWGLSVYIGIWLLVGGTGTFSMKTAPLLWLMVGFVRRQSLDQLEVNGVRNPRFRYVTHQNDVRTRPSIVKTQPQIKAR